MRRATLAACLLTIACGRQETSSQSQTAMVDAAPSGVNVHLDNGSPADLIAALEHASSTKVQIDDCALPLVVCTNVSVHRDHLDLPDLAAVIAQTIRPVGLILASSPSGWAVHCTPDAPAKPCDKFKSALDASAPDLTTQKKVAETIAGIHQTAPAHYTLSQHARATIIDPENSTFFQARIVPEVDGGASSYRFFGIRSTDVLGALGFVNGDLVSTICGRFPYSSDGLRDGFTALGTAPCEAKITRGTASITLVYTLSPR